MLSYQYTARNPATGQQVKAMVEAESEASAAKLVSDQGLVPINIKLANQTGNLLGKLGNHIKTDDRVLFSRQLSTLINAGLPLLQALRSVNQQTVSKPLRVVLSSIISDIEGGSTLSAAMGKYPRVFNQV
jgi:type IV pilus assembly protein PilC